MVDTAEVQRPVEVPAQSPLMSFKDVDAEGVFPWGIVRTYELARKGQLPIPIVRVGNRYFLHRSDVEEFKAKRLPAGQVARAS